MFLYVIIFAILSNVYLNVFKNIIYSCDGKAEFTQHHMILLFRFLSSRIILQNLMDLCRIT